MTKEEILYPKVRTKTGVRDALFNSDGLLINHDILEAMESYASQFSAEIQKENERLRGLIKQFVIDKNRFVTPFYQEEAWQKFKTDNNL